MSMCQGMPAVFLARTRIAGTTEKLTGHLIHNLPRQDPTPPAHYLPTPATKVERVRWGGKTKKWGEGGGGAG